MEVWNPCYGWIHCYYYLSNIFPFKLIAMEFHMKYYGGNQTSVHTLMMQHYNASKFTTEAGWGQRGCNTVTITLIANSSASKHWASV